MERLELASLSSASTPHRNYVTATMAPPQIPPNITSVPTRKELTSARPGQTIIHAKVGTNPLHSANLTNVVSKTNQVLQSLQAKTNGENVSIKGIRILPSGNVSFQAPNQRQNAWLNSHKHKWSKLVHPNLEATPSTYSVLVQSTPLDWDLDTNLAKEQMIGNNDLPSDSSHRLRWLGSSNSHQPTRKAGTVVISFTDPSLVDKLVKTGLFLEGGYYRTEHFKHQHPQCFCCLAMRHFSRWCKTPPPQCSRCSRNHDTLECIETSNGNKSICVVCKDNGKPTPVVVIIYRHGGK